MALQYCLLAYRDVCDNLVSELPAGEAQELATLGLAQYFAAAVTMPYQPFLSMAEKTRYDIDLLCNYFGTGFETTAQRLATLQRPGLTGVPFSFIRTDRAGNISKRQSSTAFHFARSGGSCPLWVVHRAFETPNRITRQVAAMPDGHVYLWIGRFVQGTAQSWGTPRKEFAVGLGCDISEADRIVYADALNLDVSAATLSALVVPLARASIAPACSSSSGSRHPGFTQSHRRAFLLHLLAAHEKRPISTAYRVRARREELVSFTPDRRGQRGVVQPR